VPRAWPFLFTQKSVANLVKYAEYWAFLAIHQHCEGASRARFGEGGITTMSKWEIMQRVADTRKEIETFAQDWADVPGGTRNPLAVADWERLWRQLDELFAALRGCAVA